MVEYFMKCREGVCVVLMMLKEYFKYLLILIPVLLFMNDVDEEQEVRKIVDVFNKYFRKDS
jgi:hypothetical protein